MPIPLIPIVIGVAVVSGGVTVSQVIRTKKGQKTYKAAYANAQETEKRLKATAEDFKKQAGTYGYTKAQASTTLKEAADFLEKARVKHRDFYVGTPQDFQLRLDRIQFQAEALQTILRTVGGPTAVAGAVAAPTGIYTAVGLFGVASTGTPIANLSGAAANSAILAAIGRAVGGAGMSAGASTLSAVSIGLNVISLPISIGAAVWSIKKGNETAAKVAVALKEISAAETKMERQGSIMQAVMRRMSEADGAIISARDLLSKQLAQSDPEDLRHAHAVYELADLLGQAMDAEVITASQAAELGIKINAPALGAGG